MKRSSLTRRMKAKEAAETQPASRKSREPKPKERRREKKRRRKVRRKQKVSIHFFIFSFFHFHLTLLMSFIKRSYELRQVILITEAVMMIAMNLFFLFFFYRSKGRRESTRGGENGHLKVRKHCTHLITMLSGKWLVRSVKFFSFLWVF